MGRYYSGGKLVSAETFNLRGACDPDPGVVREVWPGTAAVRPTPAGEQLSFESTSAEDDATKSSVTDVWNVTVGDVVDAGDVYRITVNTANYDYMAMMGDTNILVADGLADAVNLGSTEVWGAIPGGVLDVGDTFEITIGTASYTYACGAAETPAGVIAGLVAAVNAGAGDPLYLAVNAGSRIILAAKAPGVVATPTFALTIDPGLNATFVAAQIVVGIAADGNYTAVAAAGAVTLTNLITGTTTDTVSSSVPVDPGLNGSCVAVHTATGLTGVAGSGIRSVRVDYLDSDGLPQVENLNLNGLVPTLTTATDVVAINAITALTVGSGGSAAGTITVTNVAGTVTYEQIALGECETASAHLNVPSNRVAYVTQFAGNSTNTRTTVRVCSDTHPRTGQIVRGAQFVWDELSYQTVITPPLPPFPMGPFAPGSRVWLTCVNSGGDPTKGVLMGHLAPLP